MDQEAYASFVALDAAGRRKDASEAVRRFIGSIASDMERETWTRQFLATHRYGARIRHEIYEAVIFPVLRAGAAANDPWCLYWLAATSQNLYGAQKLFEGDAFATELAMLKRARTLAPDNGQIASALLNAFLDLFQYATHEWPAGILSGANGASLADCDAYAADVMLARALCPSPEQSAAIEDFSAKLEAYKTRLLG